MSDHSIIEDIIDTIPDGSQSLLLETAHSFKKYRSSHLEASSSILVENGFSIKFADAEVLEEHDDDIILIEIAWSDKLALNELTIRPSFIQFSAVARFDHNDKTTIRLRRQDIPTELNEFLSSIGMGL